LLEKHIEVLAIPSEVKKTLRGWVEVSNQATGGSIPEPPKATVDKVVDFCVRDVKHDILPRFTKSPFGAEILSLHPSRLLLDAPRREALLKQLSGNGSLYRAAADFWVAAHDLAAKPHRRELASSIQAEYAPRLPSMFVPVSEIERMEIEASSSTGPAVDNFLRAQTHAISFIYQAEGYHAFLASADGQAWQKGMGIDSAVFSRDRMPPPPSNAADYGADW